METQGERSGEWAGAQKPAGQPHCEPERPLSGQGSVTPDRRSV